MRHARTRPGVGEQLVGNSKREEAAGYPAPGVDTGLEFGIEELEERLTPDAVLKTVVKKTAGWGC